MKSAAKFFAWTFIAAVALFAAVNPDGGVVYQNPMATAGIGLIGLGLFMEAKKRNPEPVFERRTRKTAE